MVYNGFISPDDSDTGFAQHFALVEEYQRLINGQPDAYGSASRLLNGSNGNSNSSNGGIGGLVDGSVLYPEISMSEGDSPIRIDGDGGQAQPTKNSQSKNTLIRNGPSGSNKYDGERTSILMIEHDDSMNITLEDAIGDDDENEQGGGGAGGYDMEDSVGLDEEEEYNKDCNEVDMAGSRTKRSFVSSFGNAINHMAKGSSFPIKRPRGVSAASSSIGLSFPRLNNNLNGSTNPIVSYLADLIDIERQWLEMERERADNERSMMMYIMQILQAITGVITIEPVPALHPEINPAMQKIIEGALKSRNDSEVLVTAFSIQITRADLKSLAPCEWLNDNVINTYMEMIADRSQTSKSRLPKVHVFTTFFFPKLAKEGYSDVLKRWTRKVDIFSVDLLMFPIHLGVHWCCATADLRTKKLTFYDSLLGSHKSHNMMNLKKLLQYLSSEHMERKKEKLVESEWKLEVPKNIPIQENGSDCGVFTCKFAEYSSRDAPLTFKQENMNYFRYSMIHEIIKQELLFH